jgi:branched-chain amino acid transport system substrate-binding protein
MPRNKLRLTLPTLGMLTTVSLLGCSQAIGLDKLSVEKTAASSGGSETSKGGTAALTGGTTALGGSNAGAGGGVAGAGDGAAGSGGSPTGLDGGAAGLGGSIAGSGGSDGGLGGSIASAGGGAAGSNGGAQAKGCKSNLECTDAATLAASNGQAGSGAALATSTEPATVPAICQKATGQCVSLLSADCNLVTGDYLNEKAIIIGSLFQTQGSTASQNIPRQQSATLAIKEINDVGGIPSSTAGAARPLVMVSCNSSADLVRAASHLVNAVKVPAIVGPNNSQDTLDVSNKVTIQAGVAVVSPTAVAASIADLLDNDLTWLMIPSDDQRAQLMIKQINDLETILKAERGKQAIRLSIVYRNDALGVGTRTSLDKLILNGKALSDPSNAGSLTGNVHIAPYDYKQADQNAIVTKEVDFGPDIVVLAGTAESITKVMAPLEQQWTAGTDRPYYLIIDPSKGPELLSAVTGNDELRRRVRGTGTTPAQDSVAVANAFSLDYSANYGSAPTASGAGSCYDAAYAIAYALAATKDDIPSGSSVAKGLRMLAGGTASITTGPRDLLAAFQNLASGKTINALGTACPLDWDANGAVKGGTIEMWCIGKSADTPIFGSSGLIFDIKTQTYSGTYVQCGP